MTDLLLHEAAVDLRDPARKQIAEVGGKGILLIETAAARARPSETYPPIAPLFFLPTVNNSALNASKVTGNRGDNGR